MEDKGTVSPHSQGVDSARTGCLSSCQELTVAAVRQWAKAGPSKKMISVSRVLLAAPTSIGCCARLRAFQQISQEILTSVRFIMISVRMVDASTLLRGITVTASQGLKLQQMDGAGTRMNVFKGFVKVEDAETQKEVLNVTVLQDSTHQLTRQNALITTNVVRLECVQMENARIWMGHSDANV